MVGRMGKMGEGKWEVHLPRKKKKNLALKVIY